MRERLGLVRVDCFNMTRRYNFCSKSATPLRKFILQCRLNSVMLSQLELHATEPHAMNQISETERQQIYEIHYAKLQKAKSCNPDRCLFRIVFDNGDRGFIEDCYFAPLVVPAFRAGNPSAPLTRETQLMHCGGDPSDCSATPYISCSRDLFWCLWTAVVALLKGRAKYAQIYFIADGIEYDDTQSEVAMIGMA